MLKKILYNKFKIENIPKNLPLNSEEFMKMIFDIRNLIFFDYKIKNEFRLLGYNGSKIDAWGKATEYQPQAMAGGESYGVLTKENAVIYNENALTNSAYFTNQSTIIGDVEKYIEMLNLIDSVIIINSKQVLLPFIARVKGGQQANLLKKLLKDIFGENYQNMIVEASQQEADGTIIQPTNMQVFVQQLQDTKKKILDEAFFYLGVSSPQGKLAHQSEIEIQSASAVVDLLDEVMFDKINEFIENINKKFNLQMKLVRKI